MPLYRKKPIIVDAEQFLGTRCPECGYDKHDAETHGDHNLCLGKIPTPPRGVQIANGWSYVVPIQGQRVGVSPGEWIISEGDGVHYYPCADDVFRRTYQQESESEFLERLDGLGS